MAPAIARADTAAAGAGHKLTVRVAAGVAYLHESWSPNDGNPGSVQSGWAPALEVAVGRVLSPGLVVGGLWQGASVFSPTESYAGTDYHITQAVKLSNLVGAFVEDPRLPRVPLRARGGSRARSLFPLPHTSDTTAACRSGGPSARSRA